MKLPSIAITMGDPAGVGPELCLRLLAEKSVAKSCTPIVFGDMLALSAVANRCGLSLPNQIIVAKEFEQTILGKASEMEF